jgi:hypothetical protein
MPANGSSRSVGGGPIFSVPIGESVPRRRPRGAPRVSGSAAIAIAVLILLNLSASASAASPAYLKNWTPPYSGTTLQTTNTPVTLGCGSAKETKIAAVLKTGAVTYSATGGATTCSQYTGDSSYLIKQAAGMVLNYFSGINGTHLVSSKWALSFREAASLSGSAACGTPTTGNARALVQVELDLVNVTAGTSASTIVINPHTYSVVFKTVGHHADTLNRSVIISSNESFDGKDTYALVANVNVQAAGLVSNNATLTCAADSSVKPLTGADLTKVLWIRIS